jgi:hypothetical protein
MALGDPKFGPTFEGLVDALLQIDRAFYGRDTLADPDRVLDAKDRARLVRGVVEKLRGGAS